MSESLKSVGAITMFIDDTQRSKAFYEQVFGAKIVHEDENAVAFEFENMVSALRSRGYPSLQVELEVLPGEYHLTAPPMSLSRSLRYLFDAPR